MSAYHPPMHQALQELRELQRLLRRTRANVSKGRASTVRRLVELELGLGRVALLTRALAELGLERAAFTPEDLARKLAAIDEADGAKDDALDPRVVLPGESKLADLEPVVPPASARKRAPPRRRR